MEHARLHATRLVRVRHECSLARLLCLGEIATQARNTGSPDVVCLYMSSFLYISVCMYTHTRGARTLTFGTSGKKIPKGITDTPHPSLTEHANEHLKERLKPRLGYN